jgi:lipopolysaccharide heptosyltransferase II
MTINIPSLKQANTFLKEKEYILAAPLFANYILCTKNEALKKSCIFSLSLCLREIKKILNSESLNSRAKKIQSNNSNLDLCFLTYNLEEIWFDHKDISLTNILDLLTNKTIASVFAKQGISEIEIIANIVEIWQCPIFRLEGIVEGTNDQFFIKDNEDIFNDLDNIVFNIDKSIMTKDGQIRLFGWAYHPKNIQEISIYYNESLLGKATHLLPRKDVLKAFPDNSEMLNCGFSFHNEKYIDLDMIGLDLEIQFKLAAGERIRKKIKYELIDEREVENLIDINEIIKFNLDSPIIEGGEIKDIIKDKFSLTGWTISKNGIKKISIFLNDVFLGCAYYGVRRLDVSSAFPQFKDTLLSGFAFTVNKKSLIDGVGNLSIKVLDAKDKELTLNYGLVIEKINVSESQLKLRKFQPWYEHQCIEKIVSEKIPLPNFFISINCDNDFNGLLVTIKSLALSHYKMWNALIIGNLDESSIENFLKLLPVKIKSKVKFLKELNDKDFRKHLDKKYDYLSFIQSGDEFACDIFINLAREIAFEGPSDFIYLDDIRFSSELNHHEAFFKPDWSKDLALSVNYIGRSYFVSNNFYKKKDCSFLDFYSICTYGNILDLIFDVPDIRHYNYIMLKYNKGLGSHEQLKKSLNFFVEKNFSKVRVEDGLYPESFRLRRNIDDPVLVSIIIPTIAARELIEVCINSIKKYTKKISYEIICLDNIRNEPENKWKKWFKSNCDKVIEINEDFNWSRFNNIGAQNASGNFYLFLNDDIEVLSDDWLEVLIENAQRKDVGIVGPKLLYPDMKIQHAGLFLDKPGSARHSFRFLGDKEFGYFGFAITQRNVIGVTGACMMMRKQVFQNVGGFNENHAIINNDLDICLRVHTKGLGIIYTPFTKLIHHELASRAKLEDICDDISFQKEWKEIFLNGDPFCHKKISRDFDDWVIDTDGLRDVYAGSPIANISDIHKILIIKLDHIGDVITGLPAIRHIKSKFPNSTIHALVGKWAVQLLSKEAYVDKIYTYDFFHSQSGLGEKDEDIDELVALGKELEGEWYDLAIDLRKSPDTRDILKYAGAQYTAGFNIQNKFPWLNFTMEWEGDPIGHNKHQHIGVDFISLVDSIGNAFINQREVIKKTVVHKTQLGIDEVLLNKIYSSSIICIHPASGNELRQWPKEYFSELIDLIINKTKHNVVIIGSANESEMADEILNTISNRNRVFSLVGILKLNNLFDFIATCTLFIGNNSGPSHIAAAVGTPTLSIHSGVIASEEWAPYGEKALAIRYDLDCSPCYRATINDCHRNLDCLRKIKPIDVFNKANKFI